jgi:hypothetical protein
MKTPNSVSSKPGPGQCSFLTTIPTLGERLVPIPDRRRIRISRAVVQPRWTHDNLWSALWGAVDRRTLPFVKTMACYNTWRKGWDSNPRESCPSGGFQDRCLKPLGHPSAKRYRKADSRNAGGKYSNCRPIETRTRRPNPLPPFNVTLCELPPHRRAKDTR